MPITILDGFDFIIGKNFKGLAYKGRWTVEGPTLPERISKGKIRSVHVKDYKENSGEITIEIEISKGSKRHRRRFPLYALRLILEGDVVTKNTYQAEIL